jgi:hypothetical protein
MHGLWMNRTRVNVQRSDNGAGAVAEGGGVIAVVCADLLGGLFRFIGYAL